MKSQNSIYDPETLNLTEKAKELLDKYRKKQPFRVSIGRTSWEQYEEFKERYNLRMVLDDEIVIEFDTEDKEFVVRAISQTGINLYNAGFYFEYWDHGGKSPHLHLHDLPISHLEPDQRRLFKKIFIRKYVPHEYLPKVDITLTGIHLIAIEWVQHWKGCYGIKKLISVFDGENKKSWGFQNG